MKKNILAENMRRFGTKNLSEAKELSFKQIVNKFVKDIKLAGAPDFFISRTNKYKEDDYTRRFATNIDTDAKELELVKKWIMSKPGSHKKVGIGVDNYAWTDLTNNVAYSTYMSNNGSQYLNITKSKYKPLDTDTNNNGFPDKTE